MQQHLLLLEAAGASGSQAHLQLYGQHSLPVLPSFGWGAAPTGSTADLDLQQQQQQQPEAFGWLEAGTMPGQALAPLQGKAEGTPRTDGITPKSVFNWQPQSGTASPTTPHPEQLLQLGPDAGMLLRTKVCCHIQYAAPTTQCCKHAHDCLGHSLRKSWRQLCMTAITEHHADRTTCRYVDNTWPCKAPRTRALPRSAQGCC